MGLIFLDKRFTIPNFHQASFLHAGVVPVLAATDVNTDVGKVIEEEFGFGGSSDVNNLIKKFNNYVIPELENGWVLTQDDI